MKKRNILMCIFVSLAFFMGATIAEAKTYTTYKVGDEITVNLNDTLSEKFYVIEDNYDSVKAIYKGALGKNIKWPETMTTNTCTFKGSVVDVALKQRTEAWSNVTNISLPTANDIVGEFDYTSIDELDKLVEKTSPYGAGLVHLENLNNVPFYALNNAEGTKIFTSTVVSYNNSASTGCEIYVYGYAMTDFPYFYVSVYDYGSIRPIITVSKDNVVGGTYVGEEETLWKNFVEEFEKTELFKILEEYEININIASTSDSLKVILSDGTKSFATNFTYANGVVTYVPSDNDDNAIIDGILVLNCVYALSNIKGYDIEKVTKWLNEDRQFTLVKDGIEFEIKEFNQESNSSGVNVSISSTIYSSFKLDIKNGLKTFSNNLEEDKKDEVVDEDINNSPQTGVAFIYLVWIIGAGALGYSIYYFMKRKSTI